VKFFADENFPRAAVVAFREAGLDVSWIGETHPGASDENVLVECISTRRTLLTFDKDFGELAYRRGLPSDCGIILFRHMSKTPQDLAVFALGVVRSQASWTGYFSVVTRRRIRMRPLPSAQS
jgi:predicted nuclease of predicted toxin-antitoxin system